MWKCTFCYYALWICRMNLWIYLIRSVDISYKKDISTLLTFTSRLYNLGFPLKSNEHWINFYIYVCIQSMLSTKNLWYFLNAMPTKYHDTLITTIVEIPGYLLIKTPKTIYYCIDINHCVTLHDTKYTKLKSRCKPYKGPLQDLLVFTEVRAASRLGHWEGGIGPTPATFASSLVVYPSSNLGLLGREILPAPKAQAKSWRFFMLKVKFI